MRPMDIECYRVNYRLADWERIALTNGDFCVPIGAVRAVNALCDEVERLRALIRDHVSASNNDDTAVDTFGALAAEVSNA